MYFLISKPPPETKTEDRSLKTFRLVFVHSEDEKAFSYIPGQFAALSIAGKGEIPIGIASSPTEKGCLKFTVSRSGVVTSHLHAMKPGDIMGIRGPLGNGFPWDWLKGKTIVMIGGGFGFTTLRASIVYLLDAAHRWKFKELHVVYGARTPGMLLYMDELAEWAGRDDIHMQIVAQEAGKDWPYHVGLAPAIAQKTIPDGGLDVVAIVCGPPLMIKFTQPVLDVRCYLHQNILLSLEMRMKCGIGFCGRCNLGDKFVCKDGPVFSVATLAGLPNEY